jgi:Big-like domain-containing protein
VTGATSLFDYAPGTSTDTFTIKTWPPENPPCVLPQTTPVKPLSLEIAQQVCRGVLDRQTRANCVFDVQVTGERGFAKTYLLSQKVANGATTVTVRDDRDPTKYGELVVFTATVARRARGVKGYPIGSVQFTVDGEKAGPPVALDARGLALWRTKNLKPGKHNVAARYVPAAGSAFLPSTSADQPHVVLGGQD